MMRSVKYAAYAAIGLHFLRLCLRKSLTQVPKKKKCPDDGELPECLREQKDAIQTQIDREILHSMVEYVKTHNGDLPRYSVEFRGSLAKKLNQIVTLRKYEDEIEHGNIHCYYDSRAAEAGQKVIRVDLRPEVSVQKVNVNIDVRRNNTGSPD